MQFLDDSLLPENQEKLVIQVAPETTLTLAQRDLAVEGGGPGGGRAPRR